MATFLPSRRDTAEMTATLNLTSYSFIIKVEHPDIPVFSSGENTHQAILKHEYLELVVSETTESNSDRKINLQR